MRHNRFLEIIHIGLFFFSMLLMVKIPAIGIGQILLLEVFCFFIWDEYKDAMISVRACLRFLLFSSFIIGLFLAYLTSHFKIIDDKSAWILIPFAIGYLLTWLVTVWFADNRVSKLATMIIGQIITVLYLAVSFILNVIPVDSVKQVFNSIDFNEMIKYGYSPKDLINIAMQTIFYPVLIVALLNYLIAEIKDYLQYKKQKAYDLRNR